MFFFLDPEPELDVEAGDGDLLTRPEVFTPEFLATLSLTAVPGTATRPDLL